MFIQRKPNYEKYGELAPLYRLFRARKGIRSTDRALEEIWEYARKKSSDGSMSATMANIRDLLLSSGAPARGDKPWSNALAFVQAYNKFGDEPDLPPQMHRKRVTTLRPVGRLNFRPGAAPATTPVVTGSTLQGIIGGYIPIIG